MFIQEFYFRIGSEKILARQAASGILWFSVSEAVQDTLSKSNPEEKEVYEALLEERVPLSSAPRKSINIFH